MLWQKLLLAKESDNRENWQLIILHFEAEIISDNLSSNGEATDVNYFLLMKLQNCGLVL
jgi:hypothetical protein